MQAAQHPTQAGRDLDEALWDKARALLADELGIESADLVADTDRHYIETHAPAYAAMLLQEDADLESLYDQAHQRLFLAFFDALPPAVDTANHYLIFLAAPVVVHAAIEMAQEGMYRLAECGVDLSPAVDAFTGNATLEARV